MAKQESVFTCIGTYPGEASAQADYQAVKDLHLARAVGTYDAVVITKAYNGKVHEAKDEMRCHRGSGLYLYSRASADSFVGRLVTHG